MPNLIKIVRGARDLLPPEIETWNFVEALVRDLFRAYNFQEIRTPILEDLQLFQRSIGQETDIVSKEMFAWHEGPSVEQELERAWIKQYRDRYTDINFQVRVSDKASVDILAKAGGRFNLSESTNRGHQE